MGRHRRDEGPPRWQIMAAVVGFAIITIYGVTYGLAARP